MESGTESSSITLGTNPFFRKQMICNDTVDGRNPAPVDNDMENLPLYAGFYVCQVVQDFFHQ